MLGNRGVSWGSIRLCVCWSLLPRDLCHGRSSSHWLPAITIESVMPSSHLILCHPLLLMPPIPPSIRVFSNESTLHMRWPKYWSFSFSIIPFKELVCYNFGDSIWKVMHSTFIYLLFLTVLGLCCFADFSLVAVSWGSSLVATCGFLIAVTFLW